MVLELQEVQGSDHNKVWHGALQIQNETKELDPSCFLLHRTKQELCTDQACGLIFIITSFRKGEFKRHF